MNSKNQTLSDRWNDPASWAILLVVSVLVFFTPEITRLCLEATMTQEQRENRARYEEQVRKQGLK